MNINDYAATKADSICRWQNQGLRKAVIEMIQEVVAETKQGAIAAVKGLATRWPENESVPVGITLHYALDAISSSTPESEQEK